MFKIKTEHPFCIDSEDYKNPLGSANDFHTNPAFIKKSWMLFRRPISFLDLGCANGTFIEDCCKLGVPACGVDGSDYGVKNKTGGWGSYPDHFLNADLTKPYQIYNDEYGDVRFDVVTAWDVLEHIKEEDLPQFMQNVKNHMHQTSLFFVGIATFPCDNYHVTIKDCDWWRDYLSKDWINYHEIMDWFTPPDLVAPVEGKCHFVLGHKYV